MELTKEELQKKMRELQDKTQNDFIDKIKNDIDFLVEKANRKDYQPTTYEQEQLRKIANIINNLITWF